MPQTGAVLIQMYLERFKHKNIDTLILGCTHYPLLKAAISQYLRNVAIVDSAKAVALYTRKVLSSSALNSSGSHTAHVRFFVSDDPRGFSKLAKLFLRQRISQPKVVNV